MADCFVGEIRLFAGTRAPSGWHFCDGTVLNIAENEVLFALIGTIYGGDGKTTFALPDLRGRLPVGQGEGPGLTNRSIGAPMGTETVTLTPSQLPSHTHNMMATTSPGTTASPEGEPLLGVASATFKFYDKSTADPTKIQPFSPKAVTTNGGSGAHDNMMPFRVLNYIIALTGYFPSQN